MYFNNSFVRLNLQKDTNPLLSQDNPPLETTRGYALDVMDDIFDTSVGGIEWNYFIAYIRHRKENISWTASAKRRNFTASFVCRAMVGYTMTGKIGQRSLGAWSHTSKKIDFGNTVYKC